MEESLQDDILGFYNSLQIFSDVTLKGAVKIPIKVHYDENNGSLCFEQRGKTAHLRILNYYAGRLREIKNSWLLPSDYDELMAAMSSMINSGVLIKSRVLVSPEYFGFDIYTTATNEAKRGPRIVAELRFVSGNSWFFRKLVEYKYRIVL